MPLPAALAPKIDALVRRLASGFEGERLATLLVLERVLVAAGASFHDLADAVVAGTKPPRIVIIERDAPRRCSLSAMAEELLDHPGLSRWESGFVESLHARLQDGRRLSAKQRALLTEIYEREYEAAA
jgi:hypothetical protein